MQFVFLLSVTFLATLSLSVQSTTKSFRHHQRHDVRRHLKQWAVNASSATTLPDFAINGGVKRGRHRHNNNKKPDGGFPAKIPSPAPVTTCGLTKTPILQKHNRDAFNLAFTDASFARHFNGSMDEIRVVGGQPAKPQQIPWQVQLFDNTVSPLSDGFFCGGSIIAPNWILTAGHCVALYPRCCETIDPKTVTVLVGSLYFKGNTPNDSPCAKLVRVKKIFLHPKFAFQFSRDFFLINDVALLQLDTALDLSPAQSCYAPLCFSTSSKEPVVGEVVVASGYGCQTVDCSDPSPAHLQFTHLAIVADNAQSCFGGVPIAEFEQYKYTTICAGAKTGFDTCPGDSGGPLFGLDRKTGRYYDIGTTSYGSGDNGNPCGGTSAGKYTEIRTYVTDIRAIVRTVKGQDIQVLT